MSPYPVVFDVRLPERLDRAQLVLRIVISIVLGLIGVSAGWLFLLAYFALPATAAVVVSTSGATRYLDETAPSIQRLLRWVLSFQAYMSFLTDRFPTGEETLVHYEVTPVGAPTVRSALLRLVTSLPEIIVLAVLGWVAAVVWVLTALFVAVGARAPAGFLAYQRGLVRWQGRLLAYHASLCDVAPPYSLDLGPEPVTHI